MSDNRSPNDFGRILQMTFTDDLKAIEERASAVGAAVGWTEGAKAYHVFNDAAADDVPRLLRFARALIEDMKWCRTGHDVQEMWTASAKDKATDG